MPNWAIYDTQTNAVKKYLVSDPNDPTYPVGANEGALKDPAISNVSGQPLRYWKVINNALNLMTQGERDAVDAAITAAALAAAKLAAKRIIDGLPGYQLRGLCKLLIDEINALRERDRDRSVDVAAATSLADLKTRWAARSTLNDRTLAQAKTAYKALMDGNGLDE